MIKKYIDSHVHFWRLSNKINNWINHNDKLYHDNLLIDYINSGFNADKIVIIEAASNHYSIDELVWFEQEFYNLNTNFRYISYIDLLQSTKEFQLQLINFKIFKPRLIGFRNILATTNHYDYCPCTIDFTVHTNFINNFIDNCHVLDQADYLLELQLYPHQFRQIQDILIGLPTKIIIEHCGLPTLDNITDWINLLKIINQSNNIYLKVSGLNINANQKNSNYIIGYILKYICASKLLLGSNYPFINYNEFTRLINLFTNQQLQDIYQNSNHLYKFF